MSMEAQSHTPGVIRSTRDYIPVAESPTASPDEPEDARIPSPNSSVSDDSSTVSTSRDNPRELRNRAEKMRRDRLNQSVAELASMVPPVVAARRKIDKTTVLRLTAHYLRAHQYVFGDSIGQNAPEFTPDSAMKVLNLFNGFLITTTYRGIIVVVSQNVQQYLGYTELELLGQNLLNITHEADRALLKEQLMPKSQSLGPNGELVIPNEPDAARNANVELGQEKRQFVLRLKKLGQRSEPSQYVWCHVQGSLRKSDKAAAGSSRNYQIVRRARARSENPCASGNDIVFIGVVRPTSETFINESALETYRMEYRTRHSIDGEIIQCESRIALVTGYMTHEVSGVNAMNFMHRDDVRWVIIALREMYDQHRLYGESCYRLMTKNGQFIYMRTRGRLDVDQSSRAVTSFVCTNTVVNETEGKHFIKLMRNKFHLLVNNNEPPAIEEEIKDVNDSEPAPVEDPRRLEKVIMHLVTNLPSPATNEVEEILDTDGREKSVSPSQRLTIIPPNKERIVSAIEKIYSVININPKDNVEQTNIYKDLSKGTSFCKAQVNTAPVKQEGGLWNNTNDTTDCKVRLISPVDNNMTIIEPKLKFEKDAYLESDASDVSYMPNTDPYDIPSHFPNSNINSSVVEHKFSAPKIKCKDENNAAEICYMTAHYDEESNILQPLTEPSIGSYYTSGNKRPNEFGDQEVIYKKKISDVIKHAEPTTGCGTSPLESLFDETIFNTQIDSAIRSLGSIDPNFPDLLISNNMQDLLGQLEDDRHDSEININELDDFN